ncbi:MAG: hypothetical protein LBH91_03695 [Prevotellaceae bacterium]|jgi:nitrite reductase/ring-hydroxylating ferredoxin subunit|nr:hypothetical protein [Prevotellaceae bacterium]
MKRWFLFYCLLAVSLLTACGVEEEYNPLPYVQPDFSINIHGYPKLTGGLPVKLLEYCGYKNNKIIIVPQGFSNDKYEAFDATCTRDIKIETTSITLNDGAFTATCSKCGTVYNLRTGYAQNQSFRLHRYRANRSNDRIYITN